MIEVKSLTKKYGKHLALDNISFTVQKGEILGFLGPNGAGKSTTMNIITGYLSATKGSAQIDGIDILENPIEAKKHIGYLPENPPLYMDMTPREYLQFVCGLKKLPQKETKATIEKISQLVKIEDVLDRLIKNLSKGYKQRVGLAQALIGNPKVLVLDEPTVGLDPKQIIEIRNLVKDLSKEHTVILSSHILSEVSAVCDRVMIIDKGKIIATDTPDNLSKSFCTQNRIQARIKGDSTQITDKISQIQGITNITNQGEKEQNACDYIIETEECIDIREQLFDLCCANSFPILSMKTTDISLEEIFLELTAAQKYPQDTQQNQHTQNLQEDQNGKDYTDQVQQQQKEVE